MYLLLILYVCCKLEFYKHTFFPLVHFKMSSKGIGIGVIGEAHLVAILDLLSLPSHEILIWHR